MIFVYLRERGTFKMKKILCLMVLVSLIFLIACQTGITEGPTPDPGAAVEEPASSEEAEIAETLEDFEDLDSLEEDLDADFEELENLDLE